MLNNIIRNNDGSYKTTDTSYHRLKTIAGCSKIYKKEDILKIYYSHIPDSYRIVEDIFDTLKDIDDSSFIKLKDYYLDKKIVAYTSEYIDSEDGFNILDKDLNYIKYNFMKIEKLILLFTKLGIIIDDVNYRNYMANKDHIILIDPDRYRFFYNDDRERNITVDQLSVYNNKKLLDSFADLYIKSFYTVSRYYNLGSEEFNRMMTNVFHYDRYDNQPIYTACKRLENLRLNIYKKN